MKKRTVLILEDRDAQRRALAVGLRHAGLTTVAAKNTTEAWAELEKHVDVDVALLDVEIVPENEEMENGLQFGMQLKEARKEAPPEFLVYSVHDKPDYYQLAFTLGAADYLRKGRYGDAEIETIAQHVRALSLRRALHSERPEMALRLRAIAVSSSSRDEAIARFCGEILAEELRNTFGSGYVLLASHYDSMHWYSDQVPRPEDSAIRLIEAAVRARLLAGPLVVSAAELATNLRAVGVTSSTDSVAPLDEAVFTSLADTKDLHLALGLLPGAFQGESSESQLRILERYLHREVIANLLQIAEIWADHTMTEELRRRDALLAATSRFHLYYGQDLLAALADFDLQKHTDPELTEMVARLRSTAVEMRNAGELLTYYAPETVRADAVRARTIAMRPVIEQVWTSDVAPRLRMTADSLMVDGDCIALDWEERTRQTISQVLEWMGRRLLRSATSDLPSTLYVQCSWAPHARSVSVTFEERISRRLPEDLRQMLFLPAFDTSSSSNLVIEKSDGSRRLGLYLARSLAEIGGGALYDR
ncbi:MAG TPA: response regulator, partial [Thermoanaerobaculia bacterium]|nr:response regulator [Thermoanaerobaculia bacterium]